MNPAVGAQGVLPGTAFKPGVPPGELPRLYTTGGLVEAAESVDMTSRIGKNVLMLFLDVHPVMNCGNLEIAEGTVKMDILFLMKD